MQNYDEIVLELKINISQHPQTKSNRKTMTNGYNN